MAGAEPDMDPRQVQLLPSGKPSEPHWLTAKQQRTWRQLVAVLLTLPAALDTDLQATADITHFEYMVLMTLSEAEHHVARMNELAARTNSSPSRLSHVVSRLEKRGWVRRVSCAGDARITNAMLTEDGMAKVVETAPGHVAAVRSMVIDVLDDDQIGQLEGIAAAIAAAVRGTDSNMTGS